MEYSSPDNDLESTVRLEAKNLEQHPYMVKSSKTVELSGKG
jgi:hypothetical protein